jgi:hypothetical protein
MAVNVGRVLELVLFVIAVPLDDKKVLVNDKPALLRTMAEYTIILS